jgi:GTP-binding protein
LGRAIKFIAPDELVEATPKSIRLRKRGLDHQQRMREVKKMKDLAENS